MSAPQCLSAFRSHSCLATLKGTVAPHLSSVFGVPSYNSTVEDATHEPTDTASNQETHQPQYYSPNYSPVDSDPDLTHSNTDEEVITDP